MKYNPSVSRSTNGVEINAIAKPHCVKLSIRREDTRLLINDWRIQMHHFCTDDMDKIYIAIPCSDDSIDIVKCHRKPWENRPTSRTRCNIKIQIIVHMLQVILIF